MLVFVGALGMGAPTRSAILWALAILPLSFGSSFLLWVKVTTPRASASSLTYLPIPFRSATCCSSFFLVSSAPSSRVFLEISNYPIFSLHSRHRSTCSQRAPGSLNVMLQSSMYTRICFLVPLILLALDVHLTPAIVSTSNAEGPKESPYFTFVLPPGALTPLLRRRRQTVLYCSTRPPTCPPNRLGIGTFSSSPRGRCDLRAG